ncbi:MAG: LysR family transcriptional regulator [Lachnospiraceae bacterium]|nr:LysR family transcriptional regulator [Lachnospiraceae bacterium]
MENIIIISEEKSITKAAEKLYITQSALNQQLQKLEEELGTSLFIRTRSDWKPTPAGQVYIDAAKTIRNIKKDAYSRIHDLADRSRRRFAIGLIPERGVDMFTSIYPEFHQLCPDVLLEPVECNVRTMQKQISRGQIDLGLITLTQEQKDENTYLHMADEEIFLAVPDTHPLAAQGSQDAKNAPEISLEHFSADSFILISQSSTMYQLVKELFDDAGFQPQVLFSTSSNVSKRRMVQSGVGCALLPAVFAVPGEHIVFFRLQQRPHWEITMCCRKGAYVSAAEESFLNLCRTYWEKQSQRFL